MTELKPFIKWPWWKSQEIKFIKHLFPNNINNYYEPFVGWGSVFFNIKAKKYFINDKSKDLINLYRILKSKKKKLFMAVLYNLIFTWKEIEKIVINNSDFFIDIYKNYQEKNISELNIKIEKFLETNINILNKLLEQYFNYNISFLEQEIKKTIIRKIKRLKIIENKSWNKLLPQDILENIETVFKWSLYMYVRYLYNNKNIYNFDDYLYTALFFFIREYSYSWMFRFNSKGEFNVPYGWNSYNRKDFKKKIDYFSNQDLINHLKKTEIYNLDFESFLKKTNPQSNDFIFLDPPYDTKFSSYDKNDFDKSDQKRLANYLINNCKAKWMIVIKNTEFIFNLYNQKGINIQTFDKKYLVSFMNRNDKKVKHLIITNY